MNTTTIDQLLDKGLANIAHLRELFKSSHLSRWRPCGELANDLHLVQLFFEEDEQVKCGTAACYERALAAARVFGGRWQREHDGGLRGYCAAPVGGFEFQVFLHCGDNRAGAQTVDFS